MIERPRGELWRRRKHIEALQLEANGFVDEAERLHRAIFQDAKREVLVN